MLTHDETIQGEQCRACGGRIEAGEGVYEETAEDAAYYHRTCLAN